MKSRKISIVVVLIGSVMGLGVGQSEGTICAADQVPASSLLIPYFEVDVSQCGNPAINTVASVVNVGAASVLTRVTIWSDFAIPVLGFDLYLSGYDSYSINLRDVFCSGFLPSTGSGVSNVGAFSLSNDLFTGCNAGADPGGGPPVYGGNNALTTGQATDIRRKLRGVSSSTTGGCFGFNHGDGQARGYITVDTVNTCADFMPNEPEYVDIITINNTLIGDYAFIDNSGAVLRSHSAASLEANPSLTGVLGGPTFYGRYTSSLFGTEYADGREPLPTEWSAAFSVSANTETYLTVWREADNATSSVVCGSTPSWYPIGSKETGGGSTIFVDQNSAIGGVPGVSPDALFPLATQRVSISSLGPPFGFGWLHLGLLNNKSTTSSNSVGQSWVTVDLERDYLLTGSGRRATPLGLKCPATAVISSTP